MKKTDYFSLQLKNDRIVFLDQTKLPLTENYIETSSYERIASAIENLELRGAPLIGISAAYALALSIKEDEGDKEEIFNKAYTRLAATRPTAVNLFYALDQIKNVFYENKTSADLFNLLIGKAKELHKKDEEYCRRIGENALSLFRKKSNILTHCNTGKLATGGDGTAFNVIKTGFEHNLVSFVYVDETRPLLQGLRLTAFELAKNGIPFAVQTDSAAASLIGKGEVDFAVVGADRIALNGDTANKIGTLNLAILCNFHSIPFYVAAPSTTIDKKTTSGDDIKIEFRNKSEIINFNGIPAGTGDTETYSPAFDVTPSYLITGIITEEKIYTFPYNFLYE
jgi:methylthioribose-1-phosphate isomerase